MAPRPDRPLAGSTARSGRTAEERLTSVREPNEAKRLQDGGIPQRDQERLSEVSAMIRQNTTDPTGTPDMVSSNNAQANTVQSDPYCTGVTFPADADDNAETLTEQLQKTIVDGLASLGHPRNLRVRSLIRTHAEDSQWPLTGGFRAVEQSTGTTYTGEYEVADGICYIYTMETLLNHELTDRHLEKLHRPEQFPGDMSGDANQSDTVKKVFMRSDSSWTVAPRAKDLEQALRGEGDKANRRFALTTFIAEATFQDLLSAKDEGAFTWRRLVAALHREGITDRAVFKELNTQAEQ